MKIKKKKKAKKMRGKKMGSHGGGARKGRKGKGHHGGKGLSGSGKRADHKKPSIIKKYGNTYFGKKGITSKKTAKDNRKRINLYDIENNLKRFGKKERGAWIINLQNYKILGTGEIKTKMTIYAKQASKRAHKKIEKAGGEVILNGKIDKQKKTAVSREEK